MEKILIRAIEVTLEMMSHQTTTSNDNYAKFWDLPNNCLVAFLYIFIVLLWHSTFNFSLVSLFPSGLL
jgi:hypothetical protein